jgi:hypothetical protein
MLCVTFKAFCYIYMPVGYKLNVSLEPKRIPSVRRDSSVGIATRYGLDGPGIESR